MNNDNELFKIAIENAPKLKDIRDSLQEETERLQAVYMDLEKKGQKLAEDRELIAAMKLISKHCQEAEVGTCTKCIFHKKDKGCVLARYFPNGWAENMEEE